MNEVITVDNLSKSYADVPAVDNLSFSIEKGSVFGLLGANGAGKSTTIECILGTKKADSGRIEILGQSPFTDRKRLFERIGVQFQKSNYQENIRVGELCEVTASLYKQPADYKKLLSEFGLADKEKVPVKELSGGEQQRLFLILVLIPRPEVVFCDELTTGLDVRARRDVWNLLKNLKKQGLTILLTSHFMDEVKELCDKICILKKGKSVFYGTVAQAVESSPCDNLEDAYLWFTDEEEHQNESI